MSKLETAFKDFARFAARNIPETPALIRDFNCKIARVEHEFKVASEKLGEQRTQLASDQKSVKFLVDRSYDTDFKMEHFTFVNNCYHWVFIVKSPMSDKQRKRAAQIYKELKGE